MLSYKTLPKVLSTNISKYDFHKSRNLPNQYIINCFCIFLLQMVTVALALVLSVVSAYPSAVKYNKFISVYCTRANKGRSRLVAAPLRSHSKTHFLCVFYVTIWGPKQEFLNSGRALYWRGYGKWHVSYVVKIGL